MNTIIIADDHPVTAKGMEAQLTQMGFDVVSVFHNGLHALNHIYKDEPAYALLDMEMPGLTGLEVLQEIRNRQCPVKVIIYTMHTHFSIFEQAKEFGVDGYLLKEFALTELHDCMHALEQNKNYYSPNLEATLQINNHQFKPEMYLSLSPKERSILRLIAEQMTNKEISENLMMSEKTIESYRRKIIQKLELPNKKNALLVWSVRNKEFFSLLE